MTLRSLLSALILGLSLLPAHGWADPLQDTIGVDMGQLQSCERDGDCTLVEDFHECCTWLGVNAKYRDLVADHHSELFQKLATPEKQNACMEAECTLPKATAVCEQGQCVAKTN